MGFSRQEYWSGLPFPSPGDLPDPRIEPRSPALQTNSLPIELWGWVTANKLLLITKHPSLWIIYLLLFFAKINKLKQIWVNLKIGAHSVRTPLTGEGLGQGELLLFSATQSWPTLCNPMDCSTSGFPVLHYLPKFAQTHVHWVSDAVPPSHPVVPFSSCP